MLWGARTGADELPEQLELHVSELLDRLRRRASRLVHPEQLDRPGLGRPGRRPCRTRVSLQLQ